VGVEEDRAEHGFCSVNHRHLPEQVKVHSTMSY
jgi:hypothetical protein